MQRIRKKYAVFTLILFLTEVFIALYVRDDIIRPYVGDYLVVMLIYCFLRSLMDLPVRATAAGVLLFCYLIELAQYFSIVTRLGLQNSELASTVIGTSFEWIDMLAYTLGVLTILLFEKKNTQKELILTR